MDAASSNCQYFVTVFLYYKITVRKVKLFYPRDYFIKMVGMLNRF